MRKWMLSTAVAAFSIAGWAASAPVQEGTGAVTVKSMPPVVIATVPQAGDTNVSAGTKEIRVTFSKPMTDKSWSWSTVSKDSFPEIAGEISYSKDRRTCICPVKLEPGRTYATWLNSGKFQGFKDADGHSAVPYLLVFETKSD